MKIQTEKGMVRLTSDVYSNLTGAVATSYYGVKGMAFRPTTDGLVPLLRRDHRENPVSLRRRGADCERSRCLQQSLPVHHAC